MRIQLRRSRDEDGAVAVLVAILAVVLLVVAAFTTDFGMAYAQRQALATGADSAALAIVQAKYLRVMDPTHPSCLTLVGKGVGQDDGSQDTGEAKMIAMARINDNKPFNVAIGNPDVTVQLVCTARALEATVTINRTIDSIFGKVVGISTMHVDRTAMAALEVANTVTGGVEPFGMCVNQAQAIIDFARLPKDSNGYPAQLVKETKVWTGATSQCDSGGAGNWGWLDFPGMGNDSKGLGEMLASGYPGTVAVGDSVGVVPGARANNVHTQDAMKDLMNTTVTFPVFDKITGNGNGTLYHLVGFISVKLCGYDKTITTGINGTCYDSITNPMVSKNDMQVRYVSSTLDGGQDDGSGVCAFKACAFNAYTTKLQRVDGSPQP